MESSRKAFCDLVNSANEAQRQFKPTPESWSMENNAEHLLLSEAGIFKFFEKYPPLNSTRTVGASSKVKDFLYKFILKSPIKVKAPIESIIPKEQMNWAELQEGWQNCRNNFQELFETIPEGRENISVFKHPIAGPMNMEQTIQFIHNHTLRHFGQIQRITKDKNYPG